MNKEQAFNRRRAVLPANEQFPPSDRAVCACERCGREYIWRSKNTHACCIVPTCGGQLSDYEQPVYKLETED